MSSSVIIGLQQLKDVVETEAVFIHPGDMPYIKSADLERMMLCFDKSDKKIIIPSHNNRRGHPLLVDLQLFADLSSIDNMTKGLRGFIENFEDEIEYVLIDHNGILRDIDFPEDLQPN
jgi:molybdenum cofactor cytidylyltransferase